MSFTQLLASLMYVFMCVYMYVCTHTWSYSFVFIRMHTSMRCIYRKIICERYRIMASPLCDITASFSPYPYELATMIKRKWVLSWGIRAWLSFALHFLSSVHGMDEFTLEHRVFCINFIWIVTQLQIYMYLRTYKITVAHCLQSHDPVARLHFYRWYFSRQRRVWSLHLWELKNEITQGSRLVLVSDLNLFHFPLQRIQHNAPNHKELGTLSNIQLRYYSPELIFFWQSLVLFKRTREYRKQISLERRKCSLRCKSRY
jgi:hypothetical protein